MPSAGKEPKKKRSPTQPFISMCAKPNNAKATKVGWRVTLRIARGGCGEGTPTAAGLGLTKPATRKINEASVNTHASHRTGATSRRYQSMGPACLWRGGGGG